MTAPLVPIFLGVTTGIIWREKKIEIVTNQSKKITMSKTEIYLERDEIVIALDFNPIEYRVFNEVLKYKFENAKFSEITEDRKRQYKDAILEDYLLSILENTDLFKRNCKLDVKLQSTLLWNVKRLKNNRKIVESFQAKMAKENEILTYRNCLDWLSVMN